MRTRLLLFSLSLLAGLPSLRAGAAEPADSVVKVLATVQYPNPIQPWTKGKQVEVAGTGVVIEGGKILTSAHLVLYATEVYVQTRAGERKVEVKVEAVGPDVDLAVLTAPDGKVLPKRPALGRAKQLPKVQDNVQVYGFPVGGNDLSVTKGAVSRIDFGPYDYRGSGLLIQVSAAINPGNSGGPAVVDGHMVGLVLGRLSGDAENVGYLIPNEEIDLFLEDIKDGRYDGKPTETTATDFQRLENETLRSLLKLGPKVQGVLVLPPRDRPANYPFREFDVLTHVGSHAIDNDGMVPRPDGRRVPFPALFPQLARDDNLALTVTGGGIAFPALFPQPARDQAVPVKLLRDGKPMDAWLPVSTQDNRLIRDFRGEKPSYFIHGPLVFSPAKADAVRLYHYLKPELYAVQSPLVNRRFDRARFPGEELVVVTAPMFPHQIGKGYGDPVGQVVREVNGVAIRNLRHLVELLRDSREEYLTFRFAEEGAEVLVFRRAEMEKATQAILEDQGIAESRRGSKDMLTVWKKAPPP